MNNISGLLRGKQLASILETEWKNGVCPVVLKERLVTFLLAAVNPYDAFLDLFENHSLTCHNDHGETLVDHLWRIFGEWHSTVDFTSTPSKLVSTNISARALNVVYSKNAFCYLRTAVIVFDMKNLSALLSKQIDEMFSHLFDIQEWRSICFLLEAFPEYAVRISERDQCMLVFGCLEDNFRILRECSVLNTLTARGLQSLKQLTTEQSDALSLCDAKWLKKAKVVQDVADGGDIWRHIINHFNGVLWFAATKTYGVDNEMDQESFSDFVYEIIPLDNCLKWKLVDSLQTMRHPEAAQYWSDEFSLGTRDRTNIASSSSFYCLPTAELSIKFIDTVDSYRTALQNIKTGGHCQIGLDAEWKPIFSKSSSVSIFQVACRNVVYILDCQTLSEKLHKEDIQLMGDTLASKDLTKIGFSFREDFDRLNKTFKSHIICSNFSCCDLQQYAPKVLNALTAKGIKSVPFRGRLIETSANVRSLSNIAHVFLGKPISKLHRLSNWQRRPLHAAQITYAAIDAYCFIEIYDVLKHLCVEFGLCIEDGEPKEKRPRLGNQAEAI